MDCLAPLYLMYRIQARTEGKRHFILNKEHISNNEFLNIPDLG
jgi:hypothetical protein